MQVAGGVRAGRRGQHLVQPRLHVEQVAGHLAVYTLPDALAVTVVGVARAVEAQQAVGSVVGAGRSNDRRLSESTNERRPTFEVAVLVNHIQNL